MTCRRSLLLPLSLLALLGPGAAAASAHHHHDWDGQDDPAQIEQPGPPSTPLPAVPFNPSEYPDPYDPPMHDIEPPAPVPETEPLLPVVPVPTTQTIPGTRALVRADGRAAIPRGVPKRVRQVIAGSTPAAPGARGSNVAMKDLTPSRWVLSWCSGSGRRMAP